MDIDIDMRAGKMRVFCQGYRRQIPEQELRESHNEPKIL